MKFRTRSSDSEVEISVIPLIDVLLFLVLFFMVTTSFERQTGLKVTLPEASARKKADEPRRPLEIAIDAEGRFYLDGRAVVNTRPSTLQTALRAALKGRKDQAVMIRADEQSPFQSYVTAMDSAQLLGIKRLSIAAQPSKPGSPP